MSSPRKPLLVNSGTVHGQSHGFDDTSVPGDICMNKNTYSMMIKLTEESLTDIDHWHSIFNKDAQTYDDDSSEIPTMASIAVKVAREKGTKLNLKQIITYESMCSTVLLQLADDGEDHSTCIARYFTNAAPSSSSMD